MEVSGKDTAAADAVKLLQKGTSTQRVRKGGRFKGAGLKGETRKGLVGQDTESRDSKEPRQENLVRERGAQWG